MVSWLPHYVVPVLVALAFFPVTRRQALLWGALVWAPDMDYVIQSQHRALTHSALIPLALLASVVLLWRRRDRSARFLEFATRPGAPVGLTLAAYYVGSHLLLDLFQGGVVLLWPLVNTNFFVGFTILLDTGNNTFQGAGEGGTSEGAPELSPVYPWVSYEHTAILAFLVACALVAFGVWLRQRAAAPPRPVVVERVARVAAGERPIQKP